MIAAAEFIRRFRALTLGGVGPGLPRREQDRQILLKAVALGIAGELPCSERDLGLALRRWLAAVGPRVDVDPVSLRRALVDFGYLRRDAAGRTYELCDSHAARFAPEVEVLDPLDLMAGVRQHLLDQAGGRPRWRRPSGRSWAASGSRGTDGQRAGDRPTEGRSEYE
jgi:hypothetical protein